MKLNRSVPEAVVIPELPYRDVREAVDWLTRAFGFRERLQIGDHRAQLVYEDGAVIVIQRDEPAPANVLVRVSDATAHHEQAAAVGATILSTPEDFAYGERQYNAQDPAGHVWTFSESIADVDPADWGGTLKD